MSAAAAGAERLVGLDGGLVTLPLVGYHIGITAERRKDELSALLQRRGARTLIGTAIRLVPLADDTELLEASRSLVLDRPTHVVATTGIGFRGWMEAADGWGFGEELRGALGSAQILARGPKAKGAIRAAGLSEEWSPESESSSEVLEHLLEQDLRGARVAVQLHGEPLHFLVEAVTACGADVVEVPVYRWEPPTDTTGLDKLVETAANGGLDAVTFTSAPAVVSVLKRAGELGVLDALVDQVRSRALIACCVGPVTAAPLVELGLPSLQPERARLGSMVRDLSIRLPERDERPLVVAGHRVSVLATGVMLDGTFVDVSPTPLAVLRRLASRAGHVFCRADLAQALPGRGDEHAVEMAVARLRTALGDAKVIQTVMKRGYRLAHDPVGSY